jgi:hypothetical protein
MRWWMHAGVIGILVTGVLIGSANAERLYTSQAFTAKMIGLTAGILLTYGLTLPAARNNGAIGNVSRIVAIVGAAVFAVAVYVFYRAQLSNPGLWHVITAGALIALFATRGVTRIVYLVGLVGLIVAQQVMTHVVIDAFDYTHLDPVNKGFAWAFFAWIAVMSGVQVVTGRRGTEAGAFTRAMAYVAILVWVMTAAAGRWLAFA